VSGSEGALRGGRGEQKHGSSSSRLFGGVDKLSPDVSYATQQHIYPTLTLFPILKRDDWPLLRTRPGRSTIHGRIRKIYPCAAAYNSTSQLGISYPISSPFLGRPVAVQPATALPCSFLTTPHHWRAALLVISLTWTCPCCRTSHLPLTTSSLTFPIFPSPIYTTLADLSSTRPHSIGQSRYRQAAL